jgi:hypothetical protein
VRVFTIVVKESADGWRGEVLLGAARDSLAEVQSDSFWSVWDQCADAVDDELG